MQCIIILLKIIGSVYFNHVLQLEGPPNDASDRVKPFCIRLVPHSRYLLYGVLGKVFSYHDISHNYNLKIRFELKVSIDNK